MKTTVLLIVAMTAASALVTAQAPPTAPVVRPSEPSAPMPAVTRSRTNARFDVQIIDDGGGAPTVTKNVSLIVADRFTGRSRSSARVPPGGQGTTPAAISSDVRLPLNVDIHHREIIGGNRIHASVTIEYQPYSATFTTLPGSIQAQAEASFEDGKPLVIARTSDAITERRTTIAVPPVLSSVLV